MFKSLPPLTINSSAPQALIDSSLLHPISPGANSYATRSGYRLTLVLSAPAFIGGSDVSSSNGALVPAGPMPALVLGDDEIPYAVAPTGQSVTIQRFAQGLKTIVYGSSSSAGSTSELGFGQGGFGSGGFGQ